ncbi:pitrilysin family protein [Clostridium sp. BJN0001]|uniref:M16 family metallopeptidase n=1 Tax=Clostridium sp. BJN0001 TaxID=2930219 RepID=UPI001FCF9AA9|nr:pitrilysin family protein [Clostridium sp. BJN0001]
MQKIILDNKITLIIKHTDLNISSVCIGFEAGAGAEYDESLYGLAHAVEHMVYKGTKNRDENEINEKLTDIFGFNNAMTNYPYVIFYGTSLTENIEEGIELLSDVILNPTFKEDGFEEEMKVIKQELNEWDSDLEQYTEDRLFFNLFKKRRIKYPIIGTNKSLQNIKVSDLIKFYEKYYVSNNCVIAVVSSLEPKIIKKIIEKYFSNMKNGEIKNHYIEYEDTKSKIFKDTNNSKNTEVLIVSQINKLEKKEYKNLKIFDEFFVKGVNSVLYNALRTENSLVYDVLSSIEYDKYIKLYKIRFSASIDNAEKGIEVFRKIINNLDDYKSKFRESLEKIKKSILLKEELKSETTISSAKKLVIDYIMFKGMKEIDEMEIETEDIVNVAKKVLSNISIEIAQK